MAEPQKPLTWQEKLEQGKPLTELEQVKYDAERMTLRRIRDNEEEQRINAQREAAKYGDPELQSVAAHKATQEKDAPAEAVEKPKDSKKGN